MMLHIDAGLLSFNISEDTSGFFFSAKGAGPGDGDFWRLILDDGLRTEIPVLSHGQKGKAEEKDGKIVIEYESLLSEYGDRYSIYLRIIVDVFDGMLRFTPFIRNSSPVRVNECFCPLADFTRIRGKKEKDILYMPYGLGTRKHNPWKFMSGLNGNWYSHDDKEVFWHLIYPRASMSWFGVQSADRFLYMARYDPVMRFCYLTVRQKIHSDPSDLMLGIDHFPMLLEGESGELPGGVIGLFDGDWKTGAEKYRSYADRTFYKVIPRTDWVRKMTGWQRIILKAQNGVHNYDVSDLPELYRIGRRYGIDTLFLFGWRKKRMEDCHPFDGTECPPEYAELRENIQKVREMGGHVILESSLHFLNTRTDFYREYEEYCGILDINGNEIRPSFVYPGRGEIRAQFGAHQVPIACTGTKLWRDVIDSQFRLMASIGPDALFADCFGGCPYQPCFNRRHEHGNRVDREWTTHRMVYESFDRICEAGKMAEGTEIVTDIAASYNQFIHGLINVDFKDGSDSYPAMFRYTFPEVITTERGIRDEEGDFRERFKCALVYGLRIDAELYVCRAALDRSPAYAAAVEYYTGKLQEYSEFFFDGRFTSVFPDTERTKVRIGEFLSPDGKRLLRVLFNFSATGTEYAGTALGPFEIRFDVFGTDEYTAKWSSDPHYHR